MIRVIILCFISCCSSLVPLKDNNLCLDCNNQMQVIEKKSKYNLATSSNHSFATFSDYLSYGFLNNMVDNASRFISDDFANLTETNVTISLPQYVLGITDLRSLNLASISAIDYVDHIDLYSRLDRYNDNYLYVNTYTITFYFESDPNAYIRYTYKKYYNPDQIESYAFNGELMIDNLTNQYGSIYDVVTYPNAFYVNNYNVGATLPYWQYDMLFNFDINQDSYSRGYESGFNIGYQTGYNAGLDYAADIDSTAATIFTGIVEVGLLPVNVFLLMFNYEVFGINIAGLVSGFLTIAILIIVIRIITGGKKND